MKKEIGGMIYIMVPGAHATKSRQLSCWHCTPTVLLSPRPGQHPASSTRQACNAGARVRAYLGRSYGSGAMVEIQAEEGWGRLKCKEKGQGPDSRIWAAGTKFRLLCSCRARNIFSWAWPAPCQHTEPGAAWNTKSWGSLMCPGDQLGQESPMQAAKRAPSRQVHGHWAPAA